jgi:hypothetical protein
LTWDSPHPAACSNHMTVLRAVIREDHSMVGVGSMGGEERGGGEVRDNVC